MQDSVPVSDTEIFRPRFDAPGKDWDRLSEHVTELLHQGRIDRVPGRALAETHVSPAFERVLDGYFARGLYAQIETFLTRSELYAPWPSEIDLARWRALANHGQNARVVRLWRNHIACMKSDFWYLIAERNAGFRKPKHSGMTDAEDIARYEAMIGSIARKKADILGVMAFARSWFEYMDVPDAQLACLAAERSEIEAEERERPDGPVDPRKMDDTVFWEIIGAAGDSGMAVHVEAIGERLCRFRATAIKAFDVHLRQMHISLCKSDISRLAYLLNEGCSDDSFEAFRCWLILLGRDVCERVSNDPDSFDAAWFTSDFEGAVALLDTPLLAYERRADKPMLRKHIKGPPSDIVEFDEGKAAERLPKLAAQLARLR